MKNLLLIALVLFISCKKESAKTQNNNATEPSLTYNFSSIYTAGDFRPMFIVNVVSDTNIVDKVELIRGVYSLVWEVYKPGTATYTMYDRINNYPTYTERAFYHFLFIRKDGSKLSMPEFQVY